MTHPTNVQQGIDEDVRKERAYAQRRDAMATRAHLHSSHINGYGLDELANRKKAAKDGSAKLLAAIERARGA